VARIKYYYNTETCKYERAKATRGELLTSLSAFLVTALVVSLGVVALYFRFYDSPKEAMLKKENEELLLYYNLINKELGAVNQKLSSLEERDDNIYRTIFETSPIPQSVRSAGTGGVNRYQELLEKGLEREELVVSTLEKIDLLKKKMEIQGKSFDEIKVLAENKSKMLTSIPAIQPVKNRNLTALISGFGMRIHPIYKVKKMHTGLDFAATKGTPVYSTGDGVVILAGSENDGYGINIEIDHGFGYVTKYAHLSKCKSHVGNKIRRGEVIGFVGSTGASVAPHLHYEVIKNGVKVNPVNYFFNDLNPEEYQRVLEIASVENQSLGGN
jgi:murein DD-endopeptidase MepM/ murein hydrolase activator NlpD